MSKTINIQQRIVKRATEFYLDTLVHVIPYSVNTNPMLRVSEKGEIYFPKRSGGYTFLREDNRERFISMHGKNFDYHYDINE